MKITVLGSGTSHGVPFIGCDCAVCTSNDPRDKRLRPSILFDLEPGTRNREPGTRNREPGTQNPEPGTRFVLVDTTPDLRQQALSNHVTRLDAVLFTHAHADHITGFDDIRRFSQIQQAPIPVYADAATLADLQRMFDYAFKPPKQQGGGLPQVQLRTIGGPFTIGGVSFVPVPVLHGILPVLGFRVGEFAYLTDCNKIPDASWPLLEGVTTVIIDALRHRPHSTHFSIDEAIVVARRIGASRAYFTHISHDLGHAETCARLPAGVELAYDGLVIDM